MACKKTSKASTEVGLTDTLPPTGRRIILNTIKSARVEMGKLYRDARNGTITPAAASKLAYVLQQVADLIEREEAGTLAEKVAELEKRLERIR